MIPRRFTAGENISYLDFLTVTDDLRYSGYKRRRRLLHGGFSPIARIGGKRSHAAATLLVACVWFGCQCTRGQWKAGEQIQASDCAMKSGTLCSLSDVPIRFACPWSWSSFFLSLDEEGEGYARALNCTARSSYT
jgi:hypothetical protein